MTPGLHGPSCHGTASVRHGMRAEGQPRYRGRECRRGRGRTFLLAYPSVGPAPEVQPQMVAMARHASGMRDTARVLPVRPPTVMKARTQRHRRANTCSTPGGSACPQRRWRSSAVVPRRWTTAAGGPPNAMQWGVLSASTPSRGSSGMRLSITGGQWWRRSVGDGRRTCCSPGKRAWPLVTSPASLPMAGAPTSGITSPRSPRLAQPIRRRAQANTSMCGRGSSVSCVVRSVCPQRQRGMISCVGAVSIATHLGEPSDEESTDLKHLRAENSR